MADTIKKANPSESYELFDSLIATMCQKNSATLLEAIESAGVDVNIADPNGGTLLMFAVFYAGRCQDTVRPKMIEAIHCLLQNHANVNLAHASGMTALSFALDAHQEDLAILLLEHGANFPSRIH